MSTAERTSVTRADLSEGDDVRVKYTRSTHEYEQAAVDGTVTHVEPGLGTSVRFVVIENDQERYRLLYGGSIQRHTERAGWVGEGYMAKIERGGDA